MPKSSDDKKRDEILTRMLKTPHKPHVSDKKAKAKKKGSALSAKKSRRPQVT